MSTPYERLEQLRKQQEEAARKVQREAVERRKQEQQEQDKYEAEMKLKLQREAPIVLSNMELFVRFFNDIRRKDIRITQHPVNGVDRFTFEDKGAFIGSVMLCWGEKIELTASERQTIERFQPVDSLEEQYRQTILAFDGYRVGVTIRAGDFDVERNMSIYEERRYEKMERMQREGWLYHFETRLSEIPDACLLDIDRQINTVLNHRIYEKQYPELTSRAQHELDRQYAEKQRNAGPSDKGYSEGGGLGNY